MLYTRSLLVICLIHSTVCVHPKLLISLSPTTCFLSIHRHLYSSLFSHYLWTEKTNSRKVVTQTQNPEYKHPLLTHRLEMGRFWDFPLPKNAYANSASHSHLLKAKLALPAEVGGSQECVTDSDTEFTGSGDGGRLGLVFLSFFPNACWRKPDVSCVSQSWVFLLLGKGVESHPPCWF